MTAERAHQRADLIGSLARIWRHDPEYRFGQMLMQSLHASLDLLPVGAPIAGIADGQVRAALSERWAWESSRKSAIAPPPYWDTETHTGRTFMNGLPRDPGRITPFLETLAQAWERHPDLSLCALIGPTVETLGGLGGIEDGQLRRRLARLAASPGVDSPPTSAS
jgi:hypothetical protein